jgi:competence protein ComEC
LAVLWPPAELFTRDQADEHFFDHENSIVLKLTYGDFSVLLTSAVGLPTEFAMLAALAATILKGGHHGSSGSTAPHLYAPLTHNPAVISVGTKSDYGPPLTAYIIGKRTG